MSGLRRRWYPLGGLPYAVAAARPHRAKAARKLETHRPADRPEAGPGRARGHHGRRVHRAERRRRLHRPRRHRGRAGSRASRPCRLRSGVPGSTLAGRIFPGLIELHNHLSYNALPLWSAGAEALPAPRPVAGPSRLPQAHQRSDDRGGSVPRRRRARLHCWRRWCAMSSASACWAVSPPARASCSAAMPACSASTAASCAMSSRPTIRELFEAAGTHRRHRRQGRPLVPGPTEEGRQLLPAAPQRGRDASRARPTRWPGGTSWRCRWHRTSGR